LISFGIHHAANQFARQQSVRIPFPVLGWLADFLRLVWGLPYWNSRKAWFRRSRGRTRCPCQNPSDSGRAFETGCEACIAWSKPARFRRVCPLLVETPQGLRCSVDAADVAPFWSRMLGLYGGMLLAGYLTSAITVFTVLRTIGYPVSVVHVTWPGLWHRVPQARGWFFAQKSQRAFAEGRPAEGLLYLSNAHQFDPGNYEITLELARTYQSGPVRESDLLFENLLRDHPAQRDATAQEWFRALLARGDLRKSPRSPSPSCLPTLHRPKSGSVPCCSRRVSSATTPP
jgi:hypothetical protein